MEVVIPRLQKLLLMLLDNTGDGVDLFGAEPASARETHRVEPELRQMVARLDMDVGRLATFVGIEEEAIRANP
jgi:hypothetical protein